MTTATAWRENMIEYYRSFPSVKRLQDLEFSIRELHLKGDFKASSQLIRKGEKQLSEGNLADMERHDLETELNMLRTGLESTIRERAVYPPLEQRIYAEWDEQNHTVYLLFPFPLEGILDGLSLIGISRWYAGANPQIAPTYIRAGWGGYASFEINNIPNLSVADRTLNNLVNPKEFELLNIKLYPALTLIYPSQYQNGNNPGIELPIDFHPKLRDKYKAIISVVDSNFDDSGTGIQTNQVREELLEMGINIPKTKLGTHLAELARNGYIQRTGTPSTSSVRYFPLRAAINGSKRA